MHTTNLYGIGLPVTMYRNSPSITYQNREFVHIIIACKRNGVTVRPVARNRRRCCHRTRFAILCTTTAAACYCSTSADTGTNTSSCRIAPQGGAGEGVLHVAEYHRCAVRAPLPPHARRAVRRAGQQLVVALLLLRGQQAQALRSRGSGALRCSAAAGVVSVATIGEADVVNTRIVAGVGGHCDVQM